MCKLIFIVELFTVTKGEQIKWPWIKNTQIKWYAFYFVHIIDLFHFTKKILTPASTLIILESNKIQIYQFQSPRYYKISLCGTPRKTECLRPEGKGEKIRSCYLQRQSLNFLKNLFLSFLFMRICMEYGCICYMCAGTLKCPMVWDSLELYLTGCCERCLTNVLVVKLQSSGKVMSTLTTEFWCGSREEQAAFFQQSFLSSSEDLYINLV